MKPNRDQLLAFLQNHHLAGLATVSPAGQAHATVIYYFVQPDLTLYFITKNVTRKCGYLRQDGRVGLEITDEPARQTIQLEGRASEIVDPFEFGRIIDNFQVEMKRNPDVWNDIPISHVRNGYCIFAVRPTWLCWSDFKKWDNIVLLELQGADLTI